MKVYPIRLTLLNHLFYYTEVSGGSASATITGAFLGDLALCYAFRNALYTHDSEYLYRDTPDYKEIESFGFYCSVGRPIGYLSRTETYIHNTLFTVDGFYDIKSIENSGKSPFKNFRQVQGISLGSHFEAVLFSKTELPILPPTIRIGRAKETLVKVELLQKVETDEFWLNAFSMKTIFNNLDKATEVMMQLGKVNFSYLLENYGIIKQLSLKDCKTIFEPVFD